MLVSCNELQAYNFLVLWIERNYSPRMRDVIVFSESSPFTSPLEEATIDVFGLVGK